EQIYRESWGGNTFPAIALILAVTRLQGRIVRWDLVLVQNPICEELAVHLVIQPKLNFARIRARPCAHARTTAGTLVDLICVNEKVSVAASHPEILQRKCSRIHERVGAVEDVRIHPDELHVSDVTHPRFESQHGLKFAAGRSSRASAGKEMLPFH